MSSSVERRTNPTAWAAFWIALAGLVLMPIPLFIGLILGSILAIPAGILGIIGLLKSRHTGGRGIAWAVLGLIFVVLTFAGFSAGGGVIW